MKFHKKICEKCEISQKVYKKISCNNREKEYEKCKLQLLKSYSFNSLTRENLELCLGWMSSCGYILEEIEYKENKIVSKKILAFSHMLNLNLMVQKNIISSQQWLVNPNYIYFFYIMIA